MKIKDLSADNMTNFSLTQNGFVVMFKDADGIIRQMGSNSPSEMAEFAKVLSVVIKPKEGIVGISDI